MLDIRKVLISPERVRENNYVESKKVISDYKILKDKDGNVIKDEEGKPVKELFIRPLAAILPNLKNKSALQKLLSLRTRTLQELLIQHPLQQRLILLIYMPKQGAI